MLDKKKIISIFRCLCVKFRVFPALHEGLTLLKLRNMLLNIIALSAKVYIFADKLMVMRKLVVAIIVSVCTVMSFARSVNDVRQILVGEWYKEGTNVPGWTKYNANGTGSIMMHVFLFEDSLGDFTWTLTDENTLVCVLPNNKVSRETITIIDNNTMMLNGERYIRRGSKKTSTNGDAKPTKSVSQGGGSGNATGKQHAPVVNTAKPIVIKCVDSADDFPEMYKNLIGLPYDFRDSNISDIKAYCKSKGYEFTGKDYQNMEFIQVSNPVTEIFGVNFEVRIHESSGLVVEKGLHAKMSLEWYSEPYPTTAMLNSAFKRFTDEIEKAGGVFEGYDETCHRSIYQFPNGVKVTAKAWEHNREIQLFVKLP